MLPRLRTCKFGPTDEPTRDHVLTTDAEQLLVWGQRVLAAETLAEVFAAHSER